MRRDNQKQGEQVGDKVCARVYVKQKKVQANLMGPFIQARHELQAETMTWAAQQIQALLVKAKGEEPVMEVTRTKEEVRKSRELGW
jgi:hypothetical protein